MKKPRRASVGEHCEFWCNRAAVIVAQTIWKEIILNKPKTARNIAKKLNEWADWKEEQDEKRVKSKP